MANHVPRPLVTFGLDDVATVLLGATVGVKPAEYAGRWLAAWLRKSPPATRLKDGTAPYTTEDQQIHA